MSTATSSEDVCWQMVAYRHDQRIKIDWLYTLQENVRQLFQCRYQREKANPGLVRAPCLDVLIYEERTLRQPEYTQLLKLLNILF